MAQTESNVWSDLRIETSFQRLQRAEWREDGGGRGGMGSRDGIEGDRTNISRDHGAHRLGTDEGSSVTYDLHSKTPPITVPRHDEPSPPEEGAFPHKPEDIQASPLDSFLQHHRPSISFNPMVTLESGMHRELEEPLAKSDPKSRLPHRGRPRNSWLRNALPQEGDEDQDHNQSNSDLAKRLQNQQAFPTGSSFRSPGAGPEAEISGESEFDRPNSLTSISTASPVVDEVRTPPGGNRDTLLSPLCVSSPQQYSPLEDRGSWANLPPFGGKSRSAASSLRTSARPSSRRSTNSSGKSPAGMFLSMWSGSEESAPRPDEEGQMVGTEYVLGKQIGFGGFSTVKEAYKVEENGETRRLAVKIVRKHVAGKSERENDEVQAEFDHEVRVWRYLNHPNVLTLDAVYETDYATFCFTKFAIGGTLFDLIRQNRRGIPLNLAKKYTYQLACALRYLHEDARVVHRDIKLENCLLDPVELPDGSKTSNLILCDFGMAEWMSTENGGHSPDPYDDAADRPPPKNIGPAGSSTSIAGSLEYASPELILSKSGVINPSVDIWAFGVIVFSVVVGSRPFQDPFPPRIQLNILSGKWNKDLVLAGAQDEQARQDREDALEVIEGCLDMDPEKRWDIHRVLTSNWFRGFADCPEGTAGEAPWKIV